MHDRNRRSLVPALVLGASLVVALVWAPSQAGSEPSSTTDALPGIEVAAAAIDGQIHQTLADASITPAPRCDDATFLRRVMLDLHGTVPTPLEVEAFVKDRKADKRTQLIETLLADEDFAAYWGMVWYRSLTGLSVNANPGRDGGQGARYLQGTAGRGFHDWLSEQIASNRPWNDVATDLMTAVGRTDKNPATVYLARWEGEPNNTIGAISKHFLGLRIQCAQCHDHMYEADWKQSDFEGMAAFVASVRVDRSPEYRRLRALRQKQQRAQSGARARREITPPSDDRAPDDAAGDMDGPEMDGPDMDGPEMDAPEMPVPQMDGPRSRRRTAGLTDAEQAELRKLMTYRNVAVISDIRVPPNMGRRRPNPNGNEQQRGRLKLLARAPKLWQADEVDRIPGVTPRMLLARWITKDDNPFFARAQVNRVWATLMGSGFVNPVDDFNSLNEPSHPALLALMSEDFRRSGYDMRRLMRIILNTEAYQRTSVWTGDREPDPQHFAKGPVRALTTDQLPFALLRAMGLEAYERGYARKQGRSLREQLAKLFSFVFDDDEGAESEDFEGSIPQGLFLMNGEALQRALSDRRGMPIDKLMRSYKTDKERITRLYLGTYSRPPTSKERQHAARFLKVAGSDAEAYQDLLWALVNSAEFMTNH